MQNSEKKLSTVINDLEKERENSVKNTLSSLSPYEIARLLESIEPKRREVLWQLIDQDDEGEVLKELVEDVRQNIIEEMDAEELIAATQDLELDDLADILNDLPNQITDQVIKALDQEDQVLFEFESVNYYNLFFIYHCECGRIRTYLMVKRFYRPLPYQIGLRTH